jgi:integrase
MTITERSIQSTKPGDKISERLRDAHGSLVLRHTESGVREFFLRSRAGGKDRLHKIGNYPEKSLLEARRSAKSLAGSPGTFEATGTLGDLLEAYVSHLKAAGKVSAGDVERTILRAIPRAHAIRRKRAAAVIPAEITNIIAARVRAGVRVEASRLRSHLRAAYSFGAKSDNDPERAAEENHVKYGITTNPVALVARIDEHPESKVGELPEPKRVLNWKELRAYWKALDAESEVITATLRFILAMGGQRMQQVLRAQWSDIKALTAAEVADHKLPKNFVGLPVLRIVDRKGKGEPRLHALPIVPFAQKQLVILKGNERPFDVTHFTLADAISRASKLVCEKLKCEPFDARALRRSVETRLGDLGVSRETRAHLLSHGRTGIQNRYDFAERLTEKRDALMKWTAHLQRAVPTFTRAAGSLARSGL